MHFIGAESSRTYDTEVALDFGDDRDIVVQPLAVHSGLNESELERLSAIVKLLPGKTDLWSKETVDIIGLPRGPEGRFLDVLKPNKVGSLYSLDRNLHF